MGEKEALPNFDGSIKLAGEGFGPRLQTDSGIFFFFLFSDSYSPDPGYFTSNIFFTSVNLSASSL